MSTDPEHEFDPHAERRQPSSLFLGAVASSKTSQLMSQIRGHQCGSSCKAHALRGVTLIEVLIVVSVLALISSAAAISIAHVANQAKIDLAKQEAATIRNAAQQWLSTVGTGECPTLAALFDDKVLDANSRSQDPWGSAYRIRCADGETFAYSLGRDRVEGSEDDIVVPVHVRAKPR